MAVQTLLKPTTAPRLVDAPTIPTKGGRVYAISFDMDVESSRLNYGDPYNNAYAEIRKVLEGQGFAWQQGSVHFGGESVNAVTCVLAAIELARARILCAWTPLPTWESNDTARLRDSP